MLLNNYNMSSLNIDLELLESISDIMCQKKLTVSVAESCTGGFVSSFFTYCSGASSFFNGATINYSNASKINLLGIDASIIDNYGIYFEVGMENTFRNQLITMNRRLGTTILLASPNEAHLKKFCSVLVYLDNGYISGVRSGLSRRIGKRRSSKKK